MLSEAASIQFPLHTQFPPRLVLDLLKTLGFDLEMFTSIEGLTSPYYFVSQWTQEIAS